MLELRCDDYSVEATIQAEYDAWMEVYAQIQEHEGDLL